MLMELNKATENEPLNKYNENSNEGNLMHNNHPEEDDEVICDS
jgi:hypothetical protein